MKDMTPKSLATWSDDNCRRRFTYNPDLDGDLEVGDTVRIQHPMGWDVIFEIEGFGDEFGDGACYAYGNCDFTPYIEQARESMPTDSLTDDMEPMVRERFKERHPKLTEGEMDAIIDGLR